MSWRLAESLKTLRAQINAAFPNRDKASDGSIGDAQHSARKSDHNPNDAGVVCAIDTDEDLSPTIHSIEDIVSAIRASKDPRVNYIIYEKRITVPGSNLQEWKPYTGPNPHDHHFHISVKQDPRLYDDPRPWDIGAGIAQPDSASAATEPAADSQRPLLKVGARGQLVRNLQEALGVNVDGAFGPDTHDAVVRFQREKGLKADGIVGPATWAELGV
jgi:murein L,D-transpeptidase YcbB/YkuD